MIVAVVDQIERVRKIMDHVVVIIVVSRQGIDDRDDRQSRVVERVVCMMILLVDRIDRVGEQIVVGDVQCARSGDDRVRAHRVFDQFIEFVHAFIIA